MGQLDLSFLARPGLAWWLALPIALGVAAYAYHRLGAPLGAGMRAALRFARAAALLLLLFALLEPMLTAHMEESGRPRLAVLVDRSSSMHLPGSKGGTRRDEAAAVIEQLAAGLGDRFQLDWQGFAQGLEPGGATEGYPWEPLGVTAMGDAIEEVLLDHGDHPVSGVVLLTDGVHTSGKDPEQVARNLPVPIFAIVVGDTTAPPDLLVRQVRAQPIGYAGEPLAFRVALAGQGFEGRSATVTIREHVPPGSAQSSIGPELARRVVTLPPEAGREMEVALELLPARVGLTLFAIDARVEGEELVTRNNTRYVAIDVRAKKTRVLYIEGAPDWDFSFLKRTLDADTSLAYTYLVRQAPDRWVAYGASGGVRLPSRDGDLAAYAAVIVAHVAPEDLSAGTAARLRRFATEGGGVLFLGGTGSGDLAPWHADWGDLLPIQLRAEPRRGFTSSATRVSVAGLAHELTVVNESPVATEEAWAALPPVLIPEGSYETARSAITLLSAQTASPAREVPLMAVAQAGAGRVGVITARGFWRWDFTMGGARQDLPVAREFWRRMMRWLSEPTQTERFVVRPVRSVFQDSEPATFRARLVDESHAPVAGARVQIEIEPAASTLSENQAGGAVADEAQVLRAELYPEGPAGQYAATLAPLPPGMYTYRASASSAVGGATTVSQASGSFWVEPMGPEFFALGAGPRLPALLASTSGGIAVDGARVGDLVSAVPERYKPVHVVRQAELWNHWVVFLALVLLLCGEWVIRRRQGLA